MKADFLIAGAGIFGVCTAIELRSRGYSVILLNPEEIPHPLAASTDISKIIRMEYGSDKEYMNMACASMTQWRKWNDVLGEIIYEETGYLILSRSDKEDHTSYEGASLATLREKGFTPEVLSPKQIAEKFPGFNSEEFSWGCFHSVGGYGYSGKAVELLCDYARKIGVVIELEEVVNINVENGRFLSVFTSGGRLIDAGHLILCSGNFTPYLLPELSLYMKVTGHPVFHLRPKNPDKYRWPAMCVFAADIARSGWYGFPLHPVEGVVKIANHGVGLDLDPRIDPRVVTDQDIQGLRQFLSECIPGLFDAPIVYTRRCCYTDTLDGHFWIDNHPEVTGITVGSGGSGHGFKMGPEIGRMIACTALNESHGYSDRYKWRKLDVDTIHAEEARNN